FMRRFCCVLSGISHLPKQCLLQVRRCLLERCYTPQSQLRTFTASTAMPVPAATPASAFFAPGSPWAKPYPPITIATRLATFAMVPVNKDLYGVKAGVERTPLGLSSQRYKHQ